jgi:hypothetical protein
MNGETRRERVVSRVPVHPSRERVSPSILERHNGLWREGSAIGSRSASELADDTASIVRAAVRGTLGGEVIA